MSKNKIRNDTILIAILLMTALAVYLVIHFTANAGAFAVVYVDSEEMVRLPLSEDVTYLIEGEGGTNTLVIEDGQAYLSDADCPDLLCVKQGNISKTGESIICLPHKAVIAIETADGETAEYDGVAE
mgnify:CR=1 FL=1